MGQWVGRLPARGRRAARPIPVSTPAEYSRAGCALALKQCEWASWQGRSVSMAALESCRERAGGAVEESQSSLYYPRQEAGFRAKESGRNLAVDPRRAHGLAVQRENRVFERTRLHALRKNSAGGDVLKGHDFSRAANAAKSTWPLGPAECFPGSRTKRRSFSAACLAPDIFRSPEQQRAPQQNAIDGEHREAVLANPVQKPLHHAPSHDE